MPETPAILPSLDSADLAELMGAFNDVAAKLQTSNQALTAEVGRLSGELRDANEQLMRSKRLAALGEMAAGIAHEIRNPLGSIGLYAEMLRDDLVDMPEQRTCATKIGAAVTGLNRIVTDVLTFSREMKPQPVPCVVADLLTRAIETVVGPEHEGLTVERLGDDEFELECDPHLVHQALVNVIRNAAEAIRDGDAQERRLSVRATRDSAHARIEIMDTGDGVDPDAIDRLFNPFHTTRATGTGLGLPIVHRVMETHGGSIELAPRTDARGTVAVLTFPNTAGGTPEAEINIRAQNRMERVA